MRGPHNLWRLIRTGATFERTGAMKYALEAFDAPMPIRTAARILGWPFRWLGYRGDPNLPPFLRALTALGPAYIKFGQTLATRPDIVGAELSTELKVLQDQLPPFPTEIAIKTVENEIEAPIDTIFSEFGAPVAAASIAQVHPAILKSTGEKVAVKILRPNIERAFQKDIDAFYFGASMIELLSPKSRRLKPSAVITHFESVVKDELDLRTETAASSEFQENTQNDAGFTVPQVYWPYSSRFMMTSEWVEGLPMGDPEALLQAGIDLEALSNRIIRMFLLHALRDGFFHGDMHQGNLKIRPDGTIIALDFGIMGRLDAYTRRVYAEILYGFLHRDYRRVAEVHFEAGYVPATQDVTAFAQALRSVGEPIFGQSATQISMARLLAHLFEVTERFGMETRTELILLQRTMVVVEGVARSINPAINMWEAGRPVVEDYIKDSLGPKAALRDLSATAKVLARFGPELPSLAERALTQARRAATSPPEKEPFTRRSLTLSLIGAAIGFAVAALIF